MRRLLIVLVLLTTLLIVVVPPPTTAQDGSSTIEHTVKVGETLYSISRRYQVTVDTIAAANNIENPNIIYLGQVLTIPAVVQPTTTPADTETPIPPQDGETLHTVAAGENLYRIAQKYGTSVYAIMQLNGLADPNVIYVGQQLRVPAGGPIEEEPTATLATTEPVATDEDLTEEPDEMESPIATTETPVPDAPQPVDTVTPDPANIDNLASSVSFAFGVQIELRNQDMMAVVGRVQELGMEWAKQDIEWAVFEPTQGNVDFATLDSLVNSLDSAGVNILLTVSGAPDWARTSTEESGPPDDYLHYANFMGLLATRYQGRVDAYEIWDEPNLRSNWNGKPISGSEYVTLLEQAYVSIKAADPAAVVVTAGLAPTGTNDGVNAVADRTFLEQMYQAGVADYADAIGAHAYGFANSPDSTCCENNPAIRGWDDHPSFFFKETLEDYRDIMTQNNDTGTFIWVTEFGWGSSDGFLQAVVDPAFGFVEWVSVDDQSLYTQLAYKNARDLLYVGPMFVWNLNYCQVYGLNAYQCYWSMLDPAGNPRPIFLAIEQMDK